MSLLNKFSFYKVKGKNNKIQLFINDLQSINKNYYLLPNKCKLRICGNDNKIYLSKNISSNKMNIFINGNNNIIKIKNNLNIVNGTININGNNNICEIGNNVDFVNSTISVSKDNNKLYIGCDTKILESFINEDGNNNNINIKDSSKVTSSEIETDGNNNELLSDVFLKYERTLLSLYGDDNFYKIETTKNAVRDAKFYVEAGSILTIGKNSELKSGDLHIVVNNGYKTKPKIIIGENVCIAKGAIIRASDGHALIDTKTGMPINPPKDIIIGNNVWIASRCTILKGAEIPDGSMVAACAMVNKKYTNKNIMLAGIPAKIIRENILWNINNYGKCMEMLENENKKFI